MTDEVVYEPTQDGTRYVVQVFNRYYTWEDADGTWNLDVGETVFRPYRTLAQATDMADLLASEIESEVRVVRRETT